MSLKGLHNKMVKAGLMEHSDYASTGGDVANMDSISFADPGVISQNAIYVRNGSIKHHFHNQTASTYALETKYDWQGLTGQAYGHDVTCEIEPGGGTPAARTAGGTWGVHGHVRLQTGFTSTAGTFVVDNGVRGQATNLGTYTGTVLSQVSGVAGVLYNLGTFNGTGIEASAGYFTIAAGAGTWTAVGNLSSLWIDSALASTVSAGNKNLLRITNSGATTWDSAIAFITPTGGAVTNGISLGTCTFGITFAATVPDAFKFTAGAEGTSCVTTNTAVPAVAPSHQLRIDIGGVSHYIPVYSDKTWDA